MSTRNFLILTFVLVFLQLLSLFMCCFLLDDLSTRFFSPIVFHSTTSNFFHLTSYTIICLSFIPSKKRLKPFASTTFQMSQLFPVHFQHCPRFSSIQVLLSIPTHNLIFILTIDFVVRSFFYLF